MAKQQIKASVQQFENDPIGNMSESQDTESSRTMINTAMSGAMPSGAATDQMVQPQVRTKKINPL